MRKEVGFFCSAQFASYIKGEEVWFGLRTDEELGAQSFENIRSNGIKLFKFQKDAQKAQKEIRKRPDLTNHGIGYMEIEIAENEDDREKLRQGKNIVILNKTDVGEDLLGPNFSDNGKTSIYPIEAELLAVNGGVSYRSYNEWVFTETGRQGGKVNLATLVEFKRIKKK